MNHELLFEILEIPSPTGREERLKAFLKTYLENLGIQPRDLGPAGLSWELGSGERLALLTAHMDQVSMLVERVDDEGYIYVLMPGIDPRIAISQEVTVWGRMPLRGVVGMIPPHFLAEEERALPIPREKIFIDVGLPPGRVKELVSPGTACTWSAPPAELLGSRVTGSGLDNRVSVFLALMLTAELKSHDLPGRVRFVASSQEEGPMLGAAFAGRSAFQASESISFAVVVDTTFATTNDVADSAFPLGKGITLGVGPVLSRPHLAKMRRVAQTLDIPYVLEPLVPSTGTEAEVLSLAGEGIPCILCSIPLRNMHSPVEVVDLVDVETAFKLLCAALCEGGIRSGGASGEVRFGGASGEVRSGGASGEEGEEGLWSC